MTCRNVRIEDAEFESLRRPVLSGWPTGAEVDIDEGVAYLQSLDAQRCATPVIERAIRDGRTLVVPRAGVAPFSKHKVLVQQLVAAGAEMAPSTIDSYTRHSRYQEIEKALRVGEREDRVVLNGYPIVNYGVRVTRELVESVPVPISLRATALHPLSAEIALAGGMTYIDNSTLHTTFGYRKNVSVEEAARAGQYIARLVGEYERRGPSIWIFTRNAFTGTMIPPCIQLVTSVFDALLSAGQGAKHLAVTFSHGWNLPQDLALCRVSTRIVREYLDRFGYQDVMLCTEASAYIGAFPPDRGRALALVVIGAIVAALGRVDMMMVKTAEEGTALPSQESNSEAIRVTRQVLDWMSGQTMFEDPHVVEEATCLEREVRCIVDRIIELGEGDMVMGMPRAFAAGVVDIPFSPSVHNAGLMIPVRDNANAIRILDPGNMPLDRETLNFHRERIAERERATSRKADYEMLIADVLSTVSAGGHNEAR